MITRGQSFADYLGSPGVHFSTLKHMATSPLHYRRACDHERASTPAQVMGAITHAAILTPTEPVGVVVWDGDRRGKAWKEFEAQHGHLAIVRRADLETSRAMRAAVLADPIARRILSEGEAEVTLTWSEGVTPCRGRVDWLAADGSIVEVKTTRSIEPRAFMSAAAKLYYHAQLAFYTMGLRAHGSEPPKLPLLIAVENQPPHDVCVYRVGFEALEAGERLIGEWLRAVRVCTASGTWPGVGGGAILDMKLPDWALSDGLPDVDLEGFGT